jgi:hypothetical protein
MGDELAGMARESRHRSRRRSGQHRSTAVRRRQSTSPSSYRSDGPISARASPPDPTVVKTQVLGTGSSTGAGRERAGLARLGRPSPREISGFSVIHPNSVRSPRPAIRAFAGQPEGSGAPGSLVPLEGVDSGGNAVMVCFGSDDCAVKHAMVLEARGHEHRAEDPDPAVRLGSRSSSIPDPDGNRIGIHSMA